MEFDTHSHSSQQRCHVCQWYGEPKAWNGRVWGLDTGNSGGLAEHAGWQPSRSFTQNDHQPIAEWEVSARSQGASNNCIPQRDEMDFAGAEAHSMTYIPNHLESNPCIKSLHLPATLPQLLRQYNLGTTAFGSCHPIPCGGSLHPSKSIYTALSKLDAVASVTICLNI